MRFSYISLAILTSIMHGAIANAACDHWLAGPLHNQPEGLQSNQIAFASTVWTPPSSGTSMLVVGGSFGSAGGVPVNFLAGWDGASWRDLGGGVGGANPFVQSLAVYNGDLIVGGNFTAVGPGGSVPAMNIARYDGTTWHAMGAGLQSAAPGSAPQCWALTVFNGELIAGGTFLNAGGQAAARIARWNGATWSAMGSGVGTANSQSDSVRALRVHTNNVLYIGGMFQTAGGVSASKIVQFNGSTYAALGSGISAGSLDRVDALNSFGNDLIVGGGFTTAGGIPVTNIARWILGGEFGGAWGTMGSGLPPSVGNGGVQALQPFNGQLVAGGHITGIVRAWNGSTWTTLGGGMTGGVSFPGVFTLNVFNGNLIAAGTFFTAGGVTATSIAQWNTSQWSALNAPTPQVIVFETFGSRFIAAGSFLQSTTTQSPAHNIIGWNGSTLTQMRNDFCCGEGTNGTIRALKSYTTATTSNLVAGGDFTVAGSVTANRIAQYNQLQIFGSGWVALGAGFNNSVHAIERFNNVTYAGGVFTASGATSLNRVAQFNGTNWVAAGNGMDGPVYALKVFNGQLYAGGDFSAIGVAPNTGGLARWNGSAWSGVNGTMPGDVYALEVRDNLMFIGGSFSLIAGVTNIVGYNGTTFFQVGGSANGSVNALKHDGQFLYAFGGFTSIGGVPCNHAARWSGSTGWQEVEGGINEVVNTLGLYRGEIQVGLGISIGLNDSDSGDEPESAAPQPGKGWVRYSPTGLPWITSDPSGQTVNCHQAATFTAQSSLGYSPLQPNWRRNGVALNNGPRPYGSVISGAQTTTLTISDTRAADAGSYDCVFTNVCGSVATLAATLTVNNCCNPDINGNNFVNVDDLLAVINAWGPCPAAPASCLADIAPVGGNGFVNVDDLLVVINGWGVCP